MSAEEIYLKRELTGVGTCSGNLFDTQIDPGTVLNQPGIEIETLKIMDSRSYSTSEIDGSMQHKQFSRKMTCVSSNSLNYAHNINVLEHMPDSLLQSSGLQRKIVKSNNQYNISYMQSPKVEQTEKLTINSNVFKERHDGKVKDSLPHSDSSTSLDFFAEGERMVSELCNISTEAHPEMPELCKSSKEFACSRCSNTKNEVDQEKIYDESIPIQIIKLAVEACTAAENIAVANKNRPCFKNIQTICEKTRSNVQKPDSAVANLHSQGVPWVIKNFIFSFVRILDGWKGIKELLCEKHESFKRIENKYYNPQIRESFIEWQVATNNMLDHIYKTFKALDSGFQAEQQRYKQNANGMNFSTMQNQNKKQQARQVGNGVVVHPQAYIPPSVHHWGGNTSYGTSPSPYLAPGSLCGKTFPQWTNLTALSNHPLSIVNNTSLVRNDIESNRSSLVNTTEKQEETKLVNNVDNSAKSFGNWNKEFSFKYQQSLVPSNYTKLEDNSNQNKGTNELPKSVALESMSLNPEPSFDRNEVREVIPSLNAHYWANEKNYTTNKCFNDSFKNFKYSESDIHQRSLPIPQTAPITSNFESDNDIHDPTKVYMKPGSYNIPIKHCEKSPDSEYGALETMTVHNSLISKAAAPKVLSLPFSKAPISSFPPPLFEYNSINKKPQPIEQNTNTGNAYSQGLGFSNMFPNLNTGHHTYYDREWEAAKQMAPKLLTNIYSKPKTDAERLYEALTPPEFVDPANKASEEVRNMSSIDGISWNKVSQNLFGEIAQPIKKLTEGTSNVNINNLIKADRENKFADSILSKEQNSEEPQNESQYKSNVFSVPNKQKETISPKESVSGDSSYLEREYQSYGASKKVKKKNSNLAIKTPTIKNNEYALSSGLKRMETILFSLWNMDNKGDSKFGLDISKAPHFYEVVKDPLVFSNILDRIQKSYYTDVHQVAHDIRSVFYNSYEYLKVYPDEKLRAQVDEMCAYFEKLFCEDILNISPAEKNRKTKKKSEFFDEKRINVFHRDGKKSLEKEKCHT